MIANIRDVLHQLVELQEEAERSGGDPGDNHKSASIHGLLKKETWVHAGTFLPTSTMQALYQRADLPPERLRPHRLVYCQERLL